MKVREKASDRRAEVHIHVQEQVDELAEYGQYVDPIDRAICSYVTLGDGDTIKITGRFNGTTLSIVHDLFVDGVLRKSNNTVAKAVSQQKNKKLDFETALYQKEDNGEKKILDTQMKIVPVSGVNFNQGDGAETFGTIELRLYVLRTFGAECPLNNDVRTYLDDEQDEEDKDGEKVTKKATYRAICPDVMVEFEKNCQEVDKKTANAWKKKLFTKRPCKLPWATFRFHYRTKEAIDAKGMELSHNPKAKGKSEGPHILELEYLPTLVIGAKPSKADDGGSTRADSLTPVPGTPLTLGSPLMQRPSSLLAQRHHTIEDASSETTVVEEVTGKMETTKPTKPEPTEPKHIESNKPTEPHPVRPSTSTPTPIAPMFSDAPTSKRPASPGSFTNAPDTKRPKPMTVAEVRRQIKRMKTRREDIAKNRADLDSQLEPYMAQVREEQERLAKELEEETRAWKEELQALRDDTAMLEDLKKVESGE